MGTGQAKEWDLDREQPQQGGERRLVEERRHRFRQQAEQERHSTADDELQARGGRADGSPILGVADGLDRGPREDRRDRPLDPRDQRRRQGKESVLLWTELPGKEDAGYETCRQQQGLSQQNARGPTEPTRGPVASRSAAGASRRPPPAGSPPRCASGDEVARAKACRPAGQALERHQPAEEAPLHRRPGVPLHDAGRGHGDDPRAMHDGFKVEDDKTRIHERAPQLRRAIGCTDKIGHDAQAVEQAVGQQPAERNDRIRPIVERRRSDSHRVSARGATRAD